MWSLNEKNEKYYEIVKVTEVKEENLSIVELLHKKTKCKIVLMICDDKNRVFNIAFKTPVNNSKGIPHILEHSVLCGSKKYDVKDPFIELAKTSVNTFLNAMTFPDKTCYPIASANLKDFHNLSHVYLDAVFYPNAIYDDKIFKQEGWHYEIENIDDDLKVNGVVLNEMRGVYSNPDEILEYAILKNTFNGTNYAYDYGGSPDDIIDLTFDEFKEFHKKYYSPSNAIVYYYGDLDYNEELAFLNDEYLTNFDYIEVPSILQEVKKPLTNNIMTSYYDLDDDVKKDKAYIAYNFVVSSEKTNLDKLVLRIIDYILFSSESAIIKNELLNDGFGESIHTFYEESIKNGLYSIIVQNIDEKKKDIFIEKITDKINELIEIGIDVKKLEAGINTFYFSAVEGEFDRTPRGLTFTLSSLDTYLYDKGVATYIGYKNEFDYLKNENLNDKNNIFYRTLKRVFIDNENRSINVLLPKSGLILENDKKLKELLKDRKEKMSTSELMQIIDDNKTLKKFQSEIDSDEKLKSIPTLSINDLEEGEDNINYECTDIDELTTIANYDNDKNVIYLSVSFDITEFGKEEIYLLSIISSIISKLDLKNMSYSELDSYIDINTGGLNIKLDIYENKALFTFTIKTLIEKIDIAFDIFHKLMSESIFVDGKRMNLLLNEQKVDATTMILSSGHTAAANRSVSNISFVNSITDKLSMTGIAHYCFLSCFLKNYENNADLLNATIDLAFKKIFTKKMYVSMSTNKKYKENMFNAIKKFYEKLKKDNIFTSFDDASEEKLKRNIEKIKAFIKFEDFEKKVDKEAILVPTDVNFVAMSNSFDRCKYKGYMFFLKTLFNYEYLWTNIRVLGGAYGCMSLFGRQGLYTFVSYRDPNLTKTNETFYGIYDYLKNIDISKDRFEKYVIGSTSMFDNPITTLEKYKVSVAGYFNNRTNKDVKREREELITMSRDDIKNVADVFKNISDSSAVAIIGEKVVDEAKDKYDSVWKLMD
ncbi:MAG: insulinase family protein [Lachnospiraceae bacterium]|nr:insulinase family protein [Lachnospiraceae bacterium]